MEVNRLSFVFNQITTDFLFPKDMRREKKKKVNKPINKNVTNYINNET